MRLGAALGVGDRGPRVEQPAAAAEDASEAVTAAGEGPINAWPDDAAETSFLSEARERGEPVGATSVEAVEETDTKNLPPLDELVKRLPPEVREALDDLFRAKFTGVRRVPAKALKD